MAIKIGVDFGSNFITIFSKGIGVVLKEPAICIVTRHKRKLELVAAGAQAIKMLSRLDKDYTVIYPVNEGAVTNVEACALMMQDYINKVISGKLIKSKVEALIAISCGLTVAERRDIESVLIKAGASQVTLIETPVTVFQLGNKDNALTIIIGGDLSEVAIVSDEGIITGSSVDIAGEAFNKALAEYIAIKYRVQIGVYVSEKIKTSIGSMYENDMSTIEVSGKDLIENSPKKVEITASDVRKAITPLLDKIVEVIDSVMCSCPDNIIEEVYRNGIHLAGGSAQIAGLDEYLGARLKMSATVLADPINSVATGCGSLLEDTNTLNRLLAIGK